MLRSMLNDRWQINKIEFIGLCVERRTPWTASLHGVHKVQGGLYRLVDFGWFF